MTKNDTRWCCSCRCRGRTMLRARSEKEKMIGCSNCNCPGLIKAKKKIEAPHLRLSRPQRREPQPPAPRHFRRAGAPRRGGGGARASWSAPFFVGKRGDVTDLKCEQKDTFFPSSSPFLFLLPLGFKHHFDLRLPQSQAPRQELCGEVEEVRLQARRPPTATSKLPYPHVAEAAGGDSSTRKSSGDLTCKVAVVTEVFSRAANGRNKKVENLS